MAGSFPTSVTAYTNPTNTDATTLVVGTRQHGDFHADNNDDLEQVMTKLGAGSSTPSANTVLRGTGAGTSAFGAIVSGDITADTIVNANINSAAAIAHSKLATATSGHVIREVGSGIIGSGLIVNANVDTAAAVLVSKLAAGGTANRIVGTNDGTTMAMQQIVTAMLAANAATRMTTAIWGGSTTVVAPSWGLITAVPFTSDGFPTLLIWGGVVNNTIDSNLTYVGYDIDGGTKTQIGLTVQYTGAGGYFTIGGVYSLGSPSAGSRTLNMYLAGGSAGTRSAYAGSSVAIIEFKR